MRRYHPESGYWFDPQTGGFYSHQHGGRHHGHYSDFNFFMDDFFGGFGFQEEVIIERDMFGGYSEEIIIDTW